MPQSNASSMLNDAIGDPIIVGQTTSTGSLPVVIASDQTTVTITLSQDQFTQLAGLLKAIDAKLAVLTGVAPYAP